MPPVPSKTKPPLKNGCAALAHAGSECVNFYDFEPTALVGEWNIKLIHERICHCEERSDVAIQGFLFRFLFSFVGEQRGVCDK